MATPIFYWVSVSVSALLNIAVISVNIGHIIGIGLYIVCNGSKKIKKKKRKKEGGRHMILP